MRPLRALLLLALAACAGCTTTQLYLSADDDVTAAIIDQIGYAGDSVHLAIYTFTDSDIRDALIDAATVRGVDVMVAADVTQSAEVAQQAEALRLLSEAGVPTRTCRGFNGGIMHHKFAVIDERTVLTGSFNYTLSANNANDENLLVLTSPTLAQDYETAFQDLWSRCDEPQP